MTFEEIYDILAKSMTEQRGLVPIHLENAQAEGDLSAKARRILEQNARAVTASLGTPTSEMDDDPLFVTVLVDNSGSMDKVNDRKTGTTNADTACTCQNNTIDGLLKSEHPERVYFSTQVLNSMDVNPEHVVVDPYHPLAKAVRLNRENFHTAGVTPLYQRTVEVLSTALYQTRQAIDDWKNPRTATLIISDGADTDGGSEHQASDCTELVKSLLASPTKRHIVAAIGIDDGHTDFKATFIGMGIPEQWILTSKATPEDIAKAVGLFTKAASQAASATQEKFLMLTDGGFRGVQTQ